MRLACVSSGEQIIELETAIENDGPLVQGLVSGAVFDHVEAEFPDAIDHLLAERSIRDALNLFPGEDERRVSTYILTRALDAHVNTPREQIIHQSFEVGGPIALAGVFYATIDSHRNVQNREALDYLVNLDEPARISLFRRAGSFQTPPSMGPWLLRLLDRLDFNTKDLASLLLCLRTSIVPLVLFDRARSPSRTWGEDGELVNTPSNVLLLIQNEQRFSKALQELVGIGFASVKGRDIHVHDSFLRLPGAWGQSVQWKEEVVRLVSHSFPKHKVHHGREYIDLCLKLLPVLRHVVTYLEELSLPQAGMYQVAEACLSASCFFEGDKSQRQHIIHAAQYAADRSNLRILAARVALRKLAVERMYGSCKELPPLVPFPQEDRRSCAFSAEAACFQAQQYMDLGLLASAHDELSRCSATLSNSPFEQVQQQEVTYMRAKVYRFEGQFLTARPLLADLVNHNTHLAEEAIIHLSAVDCELGHVEQAIATLEAQLQHKDNHITTSSSLELALAHAQLMKVLVQVRDQRLPQFSHPSLCETYRECLASLSAHAIGAPLVFGQIGIASGTAMLAHLRGDIDTALAEWNRTLGLARGAEVAKLWCLWSPKDEDVGFRTTLFFSDAADAIFYFVDIQNRVVTVRRLLSESISFMRPQALNDWVVLFSKLMILGEYLWEANNRAMQFKFAGLILCILARWFLNILIPQQSGAMIELIGYSEKKEYIATERVINGWHTMFSFGQAQKEHDCYSKAVQSHVGATETNHWLRVISSLAKRLMLLAAQVVSVLIVLCRIQEGKATPGDFMVAVACWAKFQDYTARISYLLLEAPGQVLEIDSIVQILGLSLDDPNRSQPLHLTGGRVEFQDVSFSFGKNIVLKDVCMIIPPGTIAALVGETGSGKSTILNLIQGLYQVDGGQILLDDQNIQHVAPESEASEETIVAASKLAYIHDRIMDWTDDYKTFVDVDRPKLSMGEVDRIKIARALAGNSRILLLDEPTKALDLATEKKIMKAIFSHKNINTVVMAAHRPHILVDVDIIFFLEKGSIVEKGTLEELLSLNGKFASFWKLQMELGVGEEVPTSTPYTSRHTIG
ncbi:hypothetical protein GQX73_g10268 [Xylaria multiplex]|uniref:ABC transporter domain-containing protein n=1 Tax=Xylaria multiplex TaxID=323545 RepID=A0A7C8IPM2_9PEZI|nr:hypothetical protein GQX73_g10268 [Xylaria multiplex]